MLAGIAIESIFRVLLSLFHDTPSFAISPPCFHYRQTLMPIDIFAYSCRQAPRQYAFLLISTDTSLDEPATFFEGIEASSSLPTATISFSCLFPYFSHHFPTRGGRRV